MDYSKGINSYAYVSSRRFQVEADSANQRARIFGFVPGRNPFVGAMQMEHREISSDDIGYTEHSARYWLTGFKDGAKFHQGWAEIAPSTGNLNGSNMGTMLQTPSLILPDCMVCYGLSDAGANLSDQAYMYITENYGRWMGDLARARPQLRDMPFGTFALPGSHDAGMFTGVHSDDQARALLRALADYFVNQDNLSRAVNEALLHLGVALAERIAPVLSLAVWALYNSSVPRRGLINLAYTQKDTIAIQLELGVRHFDFRPGYGCKFYRRDDRLRHQHLFVPGYELDSFLNDVKRFLINNTSEVVVINLKTDGFLNHGDQDPSRDDLDKVIRSVFGDGPIGVGDLNDFAKTYGELIGLNRRVIIVHDPHVYGTYGEDYATDDPQKIINRIDSKLGSKKSEERSDDCMTVLELQGTNSATWRGYASFLSFSDCSSPLLYTKPIFDHALYPWIADERNVARRCGPQPLVLLNDFVDNALVGHAISITQQRMG